MRKLIGFAAAAILSLAGLSVAPAHAETYAGDQLTIEMPTVTVTDEACIAEAPGTAAPGSLAVSGPGIGDVRVLDGSGKPVADQAKLPAGTYRVVVSVEHSWQAFAAPSDGWLSDGAIGAPVTSIWQTFTIGSAGNCSASPSPSPSGSTSPSPSPSDPSPSDPTPSDPTPSDPTPSDPTPSDPTPSDPTPSDPTPSDPTPSDPTPSDPTPSDPTPTSSELPVPSPSVSPTVDDQSEIEPAVDPVTPDDAGEDEVLAFTGANDLMSLYGGLAGSLIAIGLVGRIVVRRRLR